MSAVWCLIVVAETGIVSVFLFLPDKGGWKKWAAGVLLIASAVLCVHFSFSEHLERTQGYSINVEACNRAETLIREGKRAELAEALKLDWWNQTVGLNYRQIAQFFLDRVQSAEEKK